MRATKKRGKVSCKQSGIGVLSGFTSTTSAPTQVPLAYALLLALFLSVGIGLIRADSANAARFKPCSSLWSGIECATLKVPLDRSGAVPGSVRLHVERIRASRKRRGVLIALAGGPGEAAAPLIEEFSVDLEPGLKTRDLVVFDQRGTGRSGALRCSSIEKALYRSQLADAGAECASRLGPQRSFYATPDSVADIEAIRRYLKVSRITLTGVSYGTKVALAYAMRYPQHVERLVLDSVVLPEGPDPFSRSTIAAIPRILRQLCAHKACRGITGDPVADFSTFAKRIRTTAVHGQAVGTDGRPREASIGRVGLVSTLVAGDFDPLLRAGLPAAIRSANDGDPASILRLYHRLKIGEHERERPSEFSEGLFTATVCEDLALPWDPAAPAEDRLRQAAVSLDAVPEAALEPFDREGVLAAASVLELCRGWPTTMRDQVQPTGPFPNVPALVLAGKDDLRTPLEDDTEIARRLLGASLVAVPRTGHSVLSNATDCGERALKRFFGDQPVGSRCPRQDPMSKALELLFNPLPLPLPPTALEQLPPAPSTSGRRGRTVTAAVLTLTDTFHFFMQDMFNSYIPLDPDAATIRGPGLRGGRYLLNYHGLRLDRMEYVPGVRVSGLFGGDTSSDVKGTAPVVLRIGGKSASRGRINIYQNGRVTGRLDGRRVRAKLDLSAQQANADSTGLGAIADWPATLRALRRTMEHKRPRLLAEPRGNGEAACALHNSTLRGPCGTSR